MTKTFGIVLVRVRKWCRGDFSLFFPTQSNRLRLMIPKFSFEKFTLRKRGKVRREVLLEKESEMSITKMYKYTRKLYVQFWPDEIEKENVEELWYNKIWVSSTCWEGGIPKKTRQFGKFEMCSVQW